MIKKLLLLSVMYVAAVSAQAVIPMRGVVYDVGLNYGGSALSVAVFDSARVAYDMGVIKDILRCNTVRVEGESLDRLVSAAEIAHAHGLKVLFNPWKHEADSAETVRYMADAADAAERLRRSGMDITFVAGCEYSLFGKGVFPGSTFNERLQWLFNLGKEPEKAPERMAAANARLNSVLAEISSNVRNRFSGPVTYSSGTWESVDWNLFDIVGVDYYRRGETDDEYMAGLQHYSCGKPVWVMEMGCCAYKGAAPRGGEAFAVFQGVDADGRAVYEGGVTPERSEKEQADYISGNIALLDSAGVDGVCVFVFSYPIYPYMKNGIDYDMISYALVKSFPDDSPRWRHIPAWVPKEAFYRLGAVYSAMEE